MDYRNLFAGMVHYRNHMNELGIPTMKISTRYCETHVYECFQPVMREISDIHSQGLNATSTSDRIYRWHK